MYQSTPWIMQIQNVYHMWGVDHEGVEFIGNK